MAQVIKRVWKSGPRKVKRVAWGYTLQVPCNPCPHRHPTTGAVLHPRGVRQDRVFDSAWTPEFAEKELAARILELGAAPVATAPEPRRLEQLITDYLDFKRAKGKRSIRQDEQICAALKRGLGAGTLVAEITAQRIAQYDRDRVTQTSRLGRLVTPSTVNRELAILRHMLRLAEEWGYVGKVPRIRLAKEPEGRLRFLSEPEIARLLEACQASKNRFLTSIVTVALNTGMRKGRSSA